MTPEQIVHRTTGRRANSNETIKVRLPRALLPFIQHLIGNAQRARPIRLILANSFPQPQKPFPDILQ
jgi:hypothetical protein